MTGGRSPRPWRGHGNLALSCTAENDRFGFGLAGFDTLDGRNSGETAGYSGSALINF